MAERVTERVTVAREGSRVVHLAEADVHVHGTMTEYVWRGDTLCGRRVDTGNYLVVFAGSVSCTRCRS